MGFYGTGDKRWRLPIWEWTIVAVVLAVTAGIVRPRMSRATESDPHIGDQLLTGHLKALRAAIDAYAADHQGAFPAQERLVDQLLMYSDSQGNVSPVRSERYCYGPYLAAVPPLPVGTQRGRAGIGEQGGWRYERGLIQGNFVAEERDHSGRAYLEY